MVGQIRSYISFISIDSSDDYLKRISNMIDNIEDSATRAALHLEYENKLNEIALIRKYKRPEAIIIPPMEEVKPANENIQSIKEQLKSFEDELNDMIKEYNDFKETGKQVERNTDRKLPQIETSAYGIARMATEKMNIKRDVVPAALRSPIPMNDIVDDNSFTR